MTKFIAVLALTVLGSMSALGNFWFTYGIWPRSWGAFALFYVTGFVLLMMTSAVMKSDDK